MKIALDATYSVGRNLSGVGVYSKELLGGLAKAHPEVDFRFCYRPHRLFRSFQDSFPSNVHRALLRRGRSPSADLFHSLNQRVDSTGHRRTVTTFHDLFVLTGEYSTPEFRSRFAAQAREAAERSDRVIAVSSFTAEQVHSLLGVDRSRIRVIPHGARPHRPSIPGNEKRQKTILFVGAIQRRKNVTRLVQAFEQVPAGWKLILAGASGYDAETTIRQIERSPRQADIRVAGYVTDAALEDFYHRASIFAFPSLDEGFGMPILDAMARGIPILTSNVSALPEVSGDAALLVDPMSVDAIAGGLKKLIEDTQLRSTLVQRGLQRSQEFTWERAVGETWRVYQELL